MDTDDSEQIIQRLENFFNLKYDKALLDVVNKGETSLSVDFRELDKFDISLADLALAEPEEFIKFAERAIERLDLGEDFPHITVRFSNIPESQKVRIRDLRAEHLGKLICVEGLIRQASPVRPLVIESTFTCSNCGNLILFEQNGRSYQQPMKCVCGKKGPFSVVEEKKTDSQKLTIEERPESLEGGEQPSRVEIFLRDDLVDPSMTKKVTPGSTVLIYGILHDYPLFTKQGTKTPRFEILLEANNIEPLAEELEEMELNEDEIEEIKRLASQPDIYERLRLSIAPSIIGHDEIKSAIVLFLFGGVRKKRKDGTETRGDIHLLLIGDPGAGKSKMLESVKHISPKSRFVSGQGASAAGLTASVVRDESIRGWTLEAGTLVLANKGVAIIDELDKMSDEDRSAMHEAMEQQTVTVSKANIHATLRCQAAVIAAANPKSGRFNIFEPIPDQIRLPPTLINRFDLIFPIRDIPDMEKDRTMAEHVLKLHRSPDSKEPPISSDLLRKYLGYAKRTANPRLSEEAIYVIRDFFVDLRSSFSDETGKSSVPISARQLESLVRLSEAAARIRLAKEATEDDARLAIGLLEYWLHQVGEDPVTGKLDIDRISGSMSSGRRSKIPIIKKIIDDLSKESEDGTVQVLAAQERAKEEGITDLDFQKIINKLLEEGDLYQPKTGYISNI